MIVLLTIAATPVFAQCEVMSRIGADEVLYYHLGYVPFYLTSSKTLYGGAITDEQNYFLALKPRPFPAKPLGNKLKDDLKVTLSNNEEYSLKHFDNRYLDYDTSLLFLYVLPEKLLSDFRTYEVVSMKMMMGDEGERVYTFKQHKSAIKDQLNCLVENLERKKRR